MKLSELKTAVNDPALDPNVIVDDDTGMTLADLRKALKENQSAFTKASQKAAEFEKQLQAQTGQLQEAAQRLQEWETYRQRVEAAAAQADQTSTAKGQNWREDPLYAPLTAEFDRVGQIHGQLATAVVNMFRQYQTDRAALFDYINKLEVSRMQGKYSDFDEEKVRDVAKRFQINDWDGAYRAFRGETQAEGLDAQLKAAREEGMKLAEEKLKAPVTELGAQPGNLSPVGEPSKGVEYGDAWKLLVPELSKALGGA